jgi:hypothetical protein
MGRNSQRGVGAIISEKVQQCGIAIVTETDGVVTKMKGRWIYRKFKLSVAIDATPVRDDSADPIMVEE